MVLLKRLRDPSDPDPSLLPASKLAKRIQELNLHDVSIDDEDMQGIEAPHFVHLTREDWVSAINEVEIDDRFIKIPVQIRDSPSCDYFQRPTKALIPYSKPSKSPVIPPPRPRKSGSNDGDEAMED